jgi:hypothetical protein
MKSLQTEVIVSESPLFMVVFGDFDCSFNLRRSFVVAGGSYLIGKKMDNNMENINLQ